MIGLLRGLHDASPLGSLFVVEADSRFDFQLLAEMGTWDVRSYPPAVVGIHERAERRA
jgi:hypothetical protein